MTVAKGGASYTHARDQQKIQNGVENIHHRGENHRLFCQAMAADDHAHGAVQGLQEQKAPTSVR